MNNNKISMNKEPRDFEKIFRDDLHEYLLSTGMVDERLPEAQILRIFGRK